MKRGLLTFFLFLWILLVFSQGSGLDKNEVLEKIAELQSNGEGFYHKGMFPSERYLCNAERTKEDNNIFFTALTTYYLKHYRKAFGKEEKSHIDTLIKRARRNYPRYSNRKEDVTYNFWQTRPDSPFPNCPMLSKWERFKLADDFDDTSIIYLTLNSHDSTEKKLRKNMVAHAIKDATRLKSIPKHYRDNQFYNTWFGEKMKDVDICVIANTLLLVEEKGFPLHHYDSASYQLIFEMVERKDHLEIPHLISPHYQNTSIILYHLARLFAESGELVPLGMKDTVIGDIRKQLMQTNHPMEKILLQTSLYRLGFRPENEIQLQDISDSFKSFAFFVANPFSLNSMTIKRIIGKSKFMQFKYRSEAYYWALVLEYFIIKENCHEFTK